ncbi:MAG: hypothetical protein LBI87_14240 [Candidatus Accumulibacter sp.]|nr:hypothetical protein [Accumulibacter sp.]
MLLSNHGPVSPPPPPRNAQHWRTKEAETHQRGANPPSQSRQIGVFNHGERDGAAKSEKQ